MSYTKNPLAGPKPQRLPWSWGSPPSTDGSVREIEGPAVRLHRAVDISADTQVVFSWICQLKAAPYSYDLIDNGGRRSPPVLTPGTGELAVGQRWMVFRITDFEVGAFITGTELPAARRLFGPMVCTYRVTPIGPAECRLTATLQLGITSPLRRMTATALAWGDLIMMRKQLLTLKQYAERDQRADQ